MGLVRCPSRLHTQRAWRLEHSPSIGGLLSPAMGDSGLAFCAPRAASPGGHGDSKKKDLSY